MTDRPQQIIPNLDAVVRYLDSAILEIVGSHDTFMLSQILEMLKVSSVDSVNYVERVEYIEKLTSIIAGIIQQGYSREYLVNKVSTFVKGSILDPDRDSLKINNALISGINCNLLQPDGKGWQKGKLKLCFEFIPEEPEPLATQKTPTEAHTSPLDEIRQLSNELTSMASLAEPLDKRIEQN